MSMLACKIIICGNDLILVSRTLADALWLELPESELVNVSREVVAIAETKVASITHVIEAREAAGAAPTYHQLKDLIEVLDVFEHRVAYFDGGVRKKKTRRGDLLTDLISLRDEMKAKLTAAALELLSEGGGDEW